MKEIIVVGGNHHNTLGVIRSLGEKKLRPILLLVTLEKTPFVAQSKYIKETVLLRKDSDIVSVLLEKYGKAVEKPVIICTSDSTSSMVDLNRDVLYTHFELPGATTQGRITSLMNKKNMLNLATNVGLCTPATFYLPEIKCLSEISFPCIVKPLISKEGTKADIKICRSLIELKNILDKSSIDLQIQEFVDKDFEYQLIGCATKDDIVIPGYSKILRPSGESNTSFLYYSNLDNSFELERCKEFIRKTGYEGLFSMEFLRDKIGRNLFMEINFRNDGNAICVTAAGVNLPYIWFLYRSGKDYSAESTRAIHPVYVMPDMQEFDIFKSGQIGFIQYGKDIIKTNRFMEWDWKDMKPFWTMILHRIRTSKYLSKK